jgi:hypothetical protein
MDKQVGHDHDVKLLGFSDELHGSVVDDHVAEGDSRALVLLGDFTTSFEEETVGQFHDVRLVNTGHMFAMVLERKVECESGDPLALRAGDDLQ